MHEIAKCKGCGAEFERRVVRGVPVATVNCPECRGGKAKPVEEAPKAHVEFRGAGGFFVIGVDGEEVAAGMVKADVIAEAEAAGVEVDPVAVNA